MHKSFRGFGLVVIILAAVMLPSSNIDPATASIFAQADAVREVATAFLDAWNAENYDLMYTMVSQQSQSLYGDAVFRTRYQDADSSIVIDAIDYTIHDVALQGTSAAVTYDVTFTSSVFGTISDEDRIMRFVNEAGSWRVAWSNFDIINNLPANGRVIVDSRRPSRGNIYDRDGDVLVEEGGTTIALLVAQQDMPNVDDCLDLLADVLQTRRLSLQRLFLQFNPESVFYVGEIDPEIDALRGGELDAICGVRSRLEQQIRRYYGHGAAAHITGYVGQIPASQLDLWLSRGYRQGDLVGLTGIENEFDEVLSGRAERLLRIVEPGGTVIRELAGAAGSPSSPLQLTIDRDLQFATAQALADAYNFAEGNWGERSPGAGIVVLDVKTGAVLAMASYPTFDPNIFNPETICCTPLDVGTRINDLNTNPNQPLLNKAIQDQYSPGSVFKIVTTTAAAAEGLIGPDELFECGLEWDGSAFGDTLPVRFDWRFADGLEATGPVTISQALTSSCDPFFYEMGARLFRERGPGTLVDYALRMGIGVQTGLDPDEAPGNLAAPTSVEAAINNAIGQGDVQVTVLQMAVATAAIANGGTVYQPYIVQQIGGFDGATLEFSAEPTVVREIGVSEDVLNIVRQGMCDVTTDTELGTAWFVFENTNYHACGKTGTAQTNREPNAWFIAYVPREDPEIAIATVVLNSREGSEVAAPITRRIIDFYLGEAFENYPEWWNNLEYIPIEIPEGGTGGG